MDILSSKIEGAFVVAPDGRLDTNTAPQAEKLLVDNISAGEKRVIFDFSKTDYISSAGLRVILQVAKQKTAYWCCVTPINRFTRYWKSAAFST